MFTILFFCRVSPESIRIVVKALAPSLTRISVENVVGPFDSLSVLAEFVTLLHSLAIKASIHFKSEVPKPEVKATTDPIKSIEQGKSVKIEKFDFFH